MAPAPAGCRSTAKLSVPDGLTPVFCLARRRKRSSSDGRRRRPEAGLRGLFFNIIRSRLGEGAASESPRSPEGLIRREGSMHLPRPSDCTMPGAPTHCGTCCAAAAQLHGHCPTALPPWLPHTLTPPCQLASIRTHTELMLHQPQLLCQCF
jgi:hypothetical protein